MEKCEENTLKCDEDVSKSMKTGEEKRIVRKMRLEDVPSVALLEAECFSEPWSEQAFSDALKQPEALMMVAEDTQQVRWDIVAFICLWMKERLQMWLCGRSVENKGLQMLF